MIAIVNGTIYDGLSDKPSKGSIIIEGSKIIEIKKGGRSHAEGRSASGGQSHNHAVIEAADKLILPGFIDIHSHADLIVYEKPQKNPKLRQGVTTEVVGNCGFSICPPLQTSHCEESAVADDEAISWLSMWEGIWGRPPAGYTRKKPVQNVFSLVGYGTLRYLITGMNNRPLTKKELDTAGKIIYDSIRSGAVGLSIGMVYPPCAFAGKDELIHMAREAARAGGYLAVHMRNEGDEVLEALAETLEIARRAGARLEISHMKAYGRKNWRKFDRMLEIIEKENSRGNEINFDIYPYTVGSTTLSTLIPNWVKEGGKSKFISRLRNPKAIVRMESDIKTGISGQENFIRETEAKNIMAIGLKSKKYRRFEGENLVEISKRVRKTIVEALCDLLYYENGGGEMLLFAMNEENVIKAIKSEYSMFGTDGLFGGRPHPRTYGTYPRIIQKYVLKDKTLTMAEAVKKMSVMPAQKARIARRGALKKGNYADIVIIDPAKIRENSTFDNPARFPSGIDHILINGRII